MAWVWQAVGLFVATDIDDLVLLSLFFSQANRAPGSTWRVVAGQYLGFAAIVAISLAGARGADLLPKHAISYLGLLPIAIGLNAALRAWPYWSRDVELPVPRIGMLAVAGITLADGGDNIGVFVPALAARPGAVRIGMVLVFLVMVAVWCRLGYLLGNRRLAIIAVRRWGRVVYPVVLVAVGIRILLTA